MKPLEMLYRSPAGRVISFGARLLARLHTPFMVYGFPDPSTGEFRKYTRMSSDTVILSRNRLAVGDHVWVWHHSILDATEGLEIGEGCQIGAWVGIFTHGSEKAIRLLGNRFVHIPNTARLGYTRGSVSIGAYSFVGAGSVILPGARVGKGCLIAAGTLVTGDVPDRAIVAGWPGKLKGTTTRMDRAFLGDRQCDTYYDKEALADQWDRK